jgi:hypothetical protein
MKRALKRLTVQICQPLAEWWFAGNNFPKEDPFHLTYSRDVYVQWKGQELHVGMSAQICARGRWSIWNQSKRLLALLFV